MENLQLSIGFSPQKTTKRNLKELSRFKQSIYDLHFPHYDPQICASGRPIDSKIPLATVHKRTVNLISWNQQHTQFKLTLLLNYLLHDNYKAVVDNVVKEFYSRGVRSFVVADIELIKRLKDAMPDSEIQGSCLSHRLTEEELQEERREGVVLHNPSVDIIRNSAQLKRNYEAGFSQKIIAFEGCLHRCPEESTKYGHRWYLARSISHNRYFCNKQETVLDPRLFLRANWVTVSRLKKLLPFIKVVKLPRSQNIPLVAGLKKFLRIFNSNKSYNIADFISSGYRKLIDKQIGEVPSHLLDDGFFDLADSCGMACKEHNCRVCFDVMEKIKDFNRR